MKLAELKAKYSDLTFEDVGPDETWKEDSVGYCFVIEAITIRKQVRATVIVDDIPRLALTGSSVGIRKLLVDWAIDRDHLAYVSYELGRAETAIRHDSPFIQE